MKIRTDYITNSSSSSFILGFKDELNMEEEIRKHAPIDYISRIYKDAKNNIISKEEAIKTYTEFARWDAYWEIAESYPTSKEFRYFQKTQSEKYNTLINDTEAKLIKEFTEKISKLECFSLVNYDDHENPALEHSIMPQMPFTMHILDDH